MFKKLHYILEVPNARLKSLQALCLMKSNTLYQYVHLFYHFHNAKQYPQRFIVT